MCVKTQEALDLSLCYYYKQIHTPKKPSKIWIAHSCSKKAPRHFNSGHLEINPKLILLPVKGTSCFQKIPTIPYQQRPERAQSQLWNAKGLQSFDSGQASNSSSLGIWRWLSLVTQRQLGLHQDFTIQEAIHVHSYQFILSNPHDEYASILITQWLLLEKCCIDLDAFPHQTLPFPLGDSTCLTWGVRPGRNNFGWSES